MAALAGAPTAEAIHAWGDLGRCRRVVSLHRIVRIIAEEHGGEIPTDPETLIKLPAICPYTAGAVACFAGSRARVEARAALEQAEEVRRLWRTWVSGWAIRRRKKGRKTSPFALVKNGAFE